MARMRKRCEVDTESALLVRHFYCHHSNMTIPERLVADFVADCPNMEDEKPPFPITNDLQKCDLPDYIQCVSGHPRCFPYHRICLYDRNPYGLLRYRNDNM